MYRKTITDLLLVLLSFSAVNAQPADQKRPNILICITDDQSWVHTSFAGEKVIETPAFDKIASEGIYFRNAFCAAPSCSPSRGSIITGQEMWRLGEATQLFSAVPKELEKVSFPLLLKENGYVIGYTQKGWEPNDFKVHGWKEYPLGKGYNEQKLQPPAKGIVNNDYAANFADFLNECPEDKPFFFWFGSSEPHRAFEENSGAKHGIDLDKIEVPGFLPDVPEVRNDIADYLFEIKWVDQNLEKMMQMLSERNLLNNTIIIFTSDNGMAFPAAKNNLYEYGIHMPLAIRWPQGIQKGGRIVDDLVSLTDLAPTLLKCAGVKVPEEMTGKSLLKIFNSTSSGQVDKSPGAPDVKSVHGWLYGDIDRSPSLNYLLDHREEDAVKALFDLATAKRPYEELYDIVNDPSCLTNLISNIDYQKDKKRLSKVLDKYLIKTGDPRALTGKSIWDEFPYYFQNPEGVVPYHNLKNK